VIGILILVKITHTLVIRTLMILVIGILMVMVILTLVIDFEILVLRMLTL
jgi:hypothetical protein